MVKIITTSLILIEIINQTKFFLMEVNIIIKKKIILFEEIIIKISTVTKTRWGTNLRIEITNMIRIKNEKKRVSPIIK